MIETDRIEFKEILTETLEKEVVAFLNYTSRGHDCGIYSELIFVESKALKQAHSKLCNCFSNAAIGIKSAARKPQPWPREVYKQGGEYKSWILGNH